MGWLKTTYIFSGILLKTFNFEYVTNVFAPNKVFDPAITIITYIPKIILEMSKSNLFSFVVNCQ